MADGRNAAAATAASSAGGMTPHRRELFLWAGLATAALAIAGVFALLLALSRIPGIEAFVSWPLDFFHKGLVIHVVFSFIVWFLAVLAALTTLVTPAGGARRLAGVGLPAVAAAAVALPLLFVPAFVDRGDATLNNYVPVIINPLYYIGLVVLGLAVAAVVLRLLANLRWRTLVAEPLTATVAAAGAIYLLALICFALAWRLLLGEAPSHAFNEDLFWGGGHVLQFANTALMLAAWALLAARLTDSGRTVVPAGFTLAAALLVLWALPAPVFYLAFPAFSAEQTEAFTSLQYALAPPVLIAMIALRGRLTGPWRSGDSAQLALVLSVLVFAAGGLLGLFVDGADTRTPAHYHGVIAGVTLALMGVFYAVLLPGLGRAPAGRRLVRWQLHLFAWGQLAACIGLFLAGGHGAPRKVAGAAQGLDGLGAVAGMAMNGLGGLIAVIGGVLFVWIVAAALLRAPDAAGTAAATVAPSATRRP
jgi:hypothetical protein